MWNKNHFGNNHILWHMSLVWLVLYYLIWFTSANGLFHSSQGCPCHLLDITWNVQMDGSYCNVDGKTNTSVRNAMQQHQMQCETLFNTITYTLPPSPHPLSPTHPLSHSDLFIRALHFYKSWLHVHDDRWTRILNYNNNLSSCVDLLPCHKQPKFPSPPHHTQWHTHTYPAIVVHLSPSRQ